VKMRYAQIVMGPAGSGKVIVVLIDCVALGGLTKVYKMMHGFTVVPVYFEIGAREGNRHLEKCIALSDVYE